MGCVVSGSFRRGGRGFQEGKGKVQSRGSNSVQGLMGWVIVLARSVRPQQWEFSHPLVREQGRVEGYT